LSGRLSRFTAPDLVADSSRTTATYGILLAYPCPQAQGRNPSVVRLALSPKTMSAPIPCGSTPRPLGYGGRLPSPIYGDAWVAPVGTGVEPFRSPLFKGWLLLSLPSIDQHFSFP